MLDAPDLACLSLSVAPWNVSSGQEEIYDLMKVFL